ncbi:MAG: AAA family ATPase [Myxococcota bacterium]
MSERQHCESGSTPAPEAEEALHTRDEFATQTPARPVESAVSPAPATPTSVHPAASASSALPLAPSGIRAILRPYFPTHLLAWAERLGQLPGEPQTLLLDGTLLLADLSGFTQLTEQLQEKGRAGAEELTEIINRVLAPMVQDVVARAGSILQFGGDAVFVLFEGEDHVTRALAGACRLMALLDEHGKLSTSMGQITLSMKVMISSGALVSYLVPTESQLLYLLSGSACERLEQISRVIQRGEVLLDPVTAALAGLPAGQDTRGTCLSWLASHPLPSAVETPPLHPDAFPVWVEQLLPPALRPLLVQGALEGELRTVAILFLKFQLPGMVEGTDAALELLTPFLNRVNRVLEAYDGSILKTAMTPLSDALLMTVGLPDSYEDCALRALLVAINLRDRIQEEHPGLRVKLSVHVGVVVVTQVGSSLRRTYDIMGDAVNLTARLLERAAWGEIWTTDAVAQKCEESVKLESLGPVQVRGREASVILYKVLEQRVAPGLDARRKIPLFVGREAELAAIWGQLGHLRSGTGAVVGIRAEAGVGKSRLWFELRKLLDARGIRYHFGVCPSYGLTHPYAVFADFLRRLLQLGEKASPSLVLEKLGMLRNYGLTEADLLPLAYMLGVQRPKQYSRGMELKLEHFQAIRHLFRGLASSGPVVLALEDLHWADPSSAELVGQLCDDVLTKPILLVLFYRPTFTSPLPEHVHEIFLRPLSPDAGARLLDALLGGKSCPRAVSRRLVEQSAGVPFFLEELVRAGIEQGWLRAEEHGWVLAPGESVETLPLPDQVDALLAARIHRLPPEAKRVAQRAAAIGRSFSYQLLEHVCGHDISGAVKILRERELVFELPPRITHVRDRELIFKHALLREVAYASMLERSRGPLHLAIAEQLVAQYHDSEDIPLERIAEHLLASESPEKAVPYLLDAARKALSQGRFVEARREAEQAELLLLRHPQADQQPLLPILLVLCDALAWQGELSKVCRLLERCQTLAQEPEAQADLLAREAFITQAMRQLDASVLAARRGLALIQQPSSSAAYGRCLRELARTEREMGLLRLAQQHFQQALQHAQQRQDRIALALTWRGLASVALERCLLNEAELALQRAEEVSRGLLDRRGTGEMLLLRGRLALLQGEHSEALASFAEAERLALEGADRASMASALCNTALAHLWSDELELMRSVLERMAEQPTPALERMSSERLLLEGILWGLEGELKPTHERLEQVCQWEGLPTVARLMGLAQILRLMVLRPLVPPLSLGGLRECLIQQQLPQRIPVLWPLLVLLTEGSHTEQRVPGLVPFSAQTERVLNHPGTVQTAEREVERDGNPPDVIPTTELACQSWLLSRGVRGIQPLLERLQRGRRD